MLKKISDWKYIIEKEGQMKTDAVLFLNEHLMKTVDSEAVKQIKNVATLPGIVGDALGMPDLHSGYGFPIGGVAAFDYENGIVCPGGIGFDKNCGIRLLTSDVQLKEIEKHKQTILNELFNAVPSGVGSETTEKLQRLVFLELVTKGIDWAIENNICSKKEKDCIEDFGRLEASTDFLSQRAVSRGLAQIGTLGSGNHFLELQVVDKVFDKGLAKEWGLKEGCVCVMIHTGSRGFGHQVATDYIKVCLEAQKKYNFDFPDPQLASVPINSKEGREYLLSMGAAANFAYVNRQMISFKVQEIFDKYGIHLNLLYDVAHNIAKKETYTINGEKKTVLVHRKGATRAFSAGNSLLPTKYQKTGQPVILPGSMGTHSFVLVGDKAEELSFGSVAHGAGRVMSRHAAKQSLTYENVMKELDDQGVMLKSFSRGGIVEEAPESYKDVSEVVDVLEKNKLAKPVVRLKPVLVVKG